MRNEYRSGIGDSRGEFNMVANFAARNPQGYGDTHKEWAFGKLFNRMENGLAIPALALYGGLPVATTVVYPEPVNETRNAPGVEFKLWRTTASHEATGLGRVTMKTAFNEACRQMGLEPGTTVRTHLDTRNPLAMSAFEAMDFKRVAETSLYEPDPDQPDQLDVIFEKYMVVPANLYDR